MKGKILVIPENILKKPFIVEVELYAMQEDEYVKLLNKKGGLGENRGRFYQATEIETFKIKPKIK